MSPDEFAFITPRNDLGACFEGGLPVMKGMFNLTHPHTRLSGHIIRVVRPSICDVPVYY